MKKFIPLFIVAIVAACSAPTEHRIGSISRSLELEHTVESFGYELARRICDSYETCCGNPDFDRTRCEAVYRSHGFYYSLEGWYAFRAGNITIDQESARECLKGISSLHCDVRRFVDVSPIRHVCFLALRGTLHEGDRCTTSMECSENLACAFGACTPLRSEGESCAMPEAMNGEGNLSDHLCSYRGNGETGLRCDHKVWPSFKFEHMKGWTCQPQVENGKKCTTETSCKEGLCEAPNLRCKAEIDGLDWCGIFD